MYPYCDICGHALDADTYADHHTIGDGLVAHAACCEASGPCASLDTAGPERAA